jgi:hypothetical protein
VWRFCAAESVQWGGVNTTPAPPTAQNDAVAPLAGARQLLLSTTSKAVTPFAGLASFIAWLRQIGFLDQAARALPFSYASPNAIPIAHTFTAFLFSVVVGGFTLDLDRTIFAREGSQEGAVKDCPPPGAQAAKVITRCSPCSKSTPCLTSSWRT